jgi:hypothetical protein
MTPALLVVAAASAWRLPRSRIMEHRMFVSAYRTLERH